jgi:hypothetical protein
VPKKCIIDRCLEGEQVWAGLEPRRMSFSKRAYSISVMSSPGGSSRKSTQNLAGGVAVACLVLGCAWTVYANVFRADVFPHLDSAEFDAPILKRSASIGAREALTVVSESFALLREQPISAQASVASGPSLSFDQRFAAAAPQGVDPKPQPELPKLAAAPKLQREASRLAETPQRPKEAASAPVRVAALPVQPDATADVRTDKSPGAALREMAQRAKAAVMSLTSSDKQAIHEKLWGKQPSLLSYASADASITGSLGQDPGQSPNPALSGSAPYDRSTAVYDISAHMVYLPDGSTLEAHSGYGSELDDPRSARVRMRGVTPPHLYELKPREALFHGVPALRLTPVGGDDTVFGRTGLLAHTYMLGPNGDSNGCVSFKDYNAFLNAYRNQGIKKLAVVARVE